MQKKVIFTIAMSSMAALPALADLQLSGADYTAPDRWKDTAMTGAQPEGESGLSCSAGVGDVINTVTLPKGKYEFAFTGLVNAKVEIKVGGSVVASYNKDGAATLKVDLPAASQDVQVVVSRSKDNIAIYSFESFEIKLVFDQAAALSALQTAFGKLPAIVSPNQYINTYNKELYLSLQGQEGELNDTKSDVEADITAVANFNLDVYVKYHLYNTPNDIATSISTLKSDIDAYNGDVNGQNTRYTNYATNIALKDQYLADQAQMNEDINKEIAKIEAFTASSDYQKKLLDRANELNAAIMNLKEEILTTFDGDALYTKIDFNKVSVLKGQLTTLQSDVKTAEADFKAYDKFFGDNGKLAELLAAYRADVTTVNSIVSSIPGFENVFDKANAANVDELTQIYNKVNDAISANKDKVAGFDALATAEDYEGDIATAIKDMAKIAKDAVDAAAEQDDNYKLQEQAYNELDAELEPYRKMEIPAEDQADWNKLLEDAETALAAYKTAVEDCFKENNLTAEGTNPSIAEARSDFRKAVSDMNAFIEAPLVYLQKSLGDLKLNIADYAQEKDLPTTGEFAVDVLEKFSSSFSNIQTAIDALKTKYQGQEDQLKKESEEVTSIIASINRTQASAETYVNGFAAAKEAITPLKWSVQTLESIRDKKTVLPESDKALILDQFNQEYLDGTDGMKTMLDKFTADYKAAAAAEGYIGVEEADQLYEDVTGYSYNFIGAKEALVKTISEANYTYAKDYYASIATQVSENSDKVGFSSFNAENKTAFEAISKLLVNCGTAEATASNVGVSADNYVTVWGNLDAACVKVVNEVDKLQAKIDALLANYDAYVALEGDRSELADQVTDAILLNQKHTPTAEAEGLYSGLLRTLNTKVSDLQSAISAAYSSKTAVAKQTELAGKIADLTTDLTSIVNQFNTTEANYNELFAAATTLRKKLDGYLSQLANTEVYNQEAVKAYVEALEKLRDTDLYNVNKEILGSTNEGKLGGDEAAALKTKYQEELDEISEAADTQLNTAKSEYNTEVARVNADILANWEKDHYNPAWNAYLDAVKQYNQYEALTNKGLVKALDFDKISDELYKYNQELQNQKAALAEEINDLNGLPHAEVIAESVVDDYAATVDGYKSEINTKLGDLNDEMNRKAIAYYAGLDAQASADYSDLESTLVGAGIPADLPKLEEVKGYLDTAEELYTKHNAEADFTVKYMDNICNNLDKVVGVNSAESIQAFAENAWSVLYDGYSEDIAAWEEDIKGFDYATNKTQELSKFNANKTDFNLLNSEVKGVKAGLIDDYADYSAALTAYYGQMEAAYTAMSDNNANNKECVDLFNDYSLKITAAQNAYDSDIVEFAAGLMARDADLVKDIQTDINTLKNSIEANKAFLNVDPYKTTIPASIANLETAIKNGYKTVQKAENGKLIETLNSAQDIFNRQVAAGALTAAQQADFSQRIDAVEVEIALANTMPVTSAAERDAYLKKAEACESELSAIIVEMDAAQLTAALDKLNTLKDEIQSSISNNETYLNGCEDEVKATYGDAYAAMSSELESIVADYEGEGNNVIELVDYFKNKLDAVKSDVNAKAQEIQKAQTNQVNYNRLFEIYTEYNNEFNELVSAIEDTGYQQDFGWYNTVTGKWVILNYLRSYLETALRDLNNAYKAGNLNGNSTLTNQTQIIDDVLSEHRRYLTYLSGDKQTYAFNALGTASNRINPNTGYRLAETERQTLRGLWNGYNQQYRTATNLRNSVLQWKDPETGKPVAQTVEVRKKFIKDLETVVTEFEAVQEGANGISVTAAEQSYFPGDVTFDPDGKVDIRDVQIVINMVVDRVSFSNPGVYSDRELSAADVVKSNTINIADVTKVISMAMDPTYQGSNWLGSAPSRIIRVADATFQGSVGAKLVDSNNGVRRYAVTLDNNVAFVGGQLDIAVAPGMTVVGCELADRTVDHEVFFKDHGDGARVVIASMENAEIQGSEGTLLFVDVEGDGNVTVENLIFSDANSIAYKLDGYSTSKVDDIIDNVANGIDRIYNAAGQTFNRIQKGINIIRNKNGKVSKEIKK